jgi:formate hydrogenlyase subunit 3/multisubunit Na+/H+ antiporter MnhD subunit
MKKPNFKGIAAMLLAVTILSSSCATILGGSRTTYQTTKPKDGEPQRQVRVGYIIADALLTGVLGLVVDFATGAIYKPEPAAKAAPASTEEKKSTE